MTVTTNPISPDIGVEIRGFPAAGFTTPDAAERCRELLARHGVVVYREAHITDPDLVTFSRMLGEVVIAGRGGHPEHPEISPVSLDPARSELAALRRSTIFWHTDGLIDETPQKATLLTAREVAEEGGDTEFANTYAAFDALPEQRGAELSRLRVVHSVAASQLLLHPDADAEQRALWDRAPAREHPLVWRHRDGRHSLLIGATAGRIVGLDERRSRELLDELLAWATRDRFVLRHRWRVGDLVIWDNTGMLHRAVPYAPTSRRLMHRTTLVGEEAVA
ncbi:TauD/TfdA dioxygenase family protein [Nocardia asteroides]|uniref:TauD/TfdA dioxygenase family protein n=1 Tax=Nocardia asteroides TaxID=1824 RepID=UPI001E3FF90B|nr:TauD/TfdA family dioxygenase [Nocardia asteroides]UGT62011.1 TauD/TfdA family dioxygenase [Nocardia asteroides]